MALESRPLSSKVGCGKLRDGPSEKLWGGVPKKLCKGKLSENRLQKWSDNNKMILNETKTKAMLASGKWLDKRLGHQQLQVKLNATELEQVNSQKLLGVKIDCKQAFDDHIDDLCRKVSPNISASLC